MSDNFRMPMSNTAVRLHKDVVTELEYLRDENTHLRSSYNAACMLVAQLHEVVMGKVVGPHHGCVEDVRNKVALQAAVIVKLRGALEMTHKFYERCTHCTLYPAVEALDTTTDSQRILADWLDTQLGEPVAWESESGGLSYENHQVDNIPLFKKPL